MPNRTQIPLGFLHAMNKKLRKTNRQSERWVDDGCYRQQNDLMDDQPRG